MPIQWRSSYPNYEKKVPPQTEKFSSFPTQTSNDRPVLLTFSAPRLIPPKDMLLQDFGAKDVIGIQGSEQFHVKSSLWVNETTSHFIDRNYTQDRRDVGLDQVVNWDSQWIEVPA